MPELPEVETARRLLAKWLRGARIVRAAAEDARGILEGSPAAFARALARRDVRGVSRRGKWLRIELDGGPLLFSHLGMTGRWVRGEAGAPPPRWQRARLEIVQRGRAATIGYVDPRRFGTLIVAREDLSAWTELGPDPLVDGLDPAVLGAALARRRTTVKEALMDQRVLAGIGNIQATEALWRARIDPRSRTGALSPADVRAIARGLTWTIERTLADAARHGDDVAYVSDEAGDNPFSVYGRKGEPCPRCRAPLARIALGGRTTTFCAGCQRRRA